MRHRPPRRRLQVQVDALAAVNIALGLPTAATSGAIWNVGVRISGRDTEGQGAVFSNTPQFERQRDSVNVRFWRIADVGLVGVE